LLKRTICHIKVFFLASCINLEQNYVFNLPDLKMDFKLTAKTNVEQIKDADIEMTETNVKKTEVDLKQQMHKYI